METKEAQLKQVLADRQEDAHTARTAHARVADEISDMRVRAAQLKQSREEVAREIERQRHEHASAIAEAEKRVALIEELRENERVLEDDTKDYAERGKALSESKEEARKKVVEAENERQGLLDASDAIEKELKGVRERTREAQSGLHKIELELRHDEDQLRFFHERISTEYHVNLAELDAEHVGTDEHDTETREQLVKETRTKLERMGAVNLTAIDEYESLTERNDFLVGQEQDLTRAREALMNVIARIDATIKEMFLDTFNAVADNFRQYFRRLFNGGQARIYLVDENDPLECGIEIEARPPGKKPQTISLLSGGEQAMTAISLLFALFKAKPSPFCVLDEVDAPLDDANIGRFITLLDEFAADTQFIVITHNKQTMSRSGALYGVTQQERGVSQLVSVKISEAAHTAA
jgi:chromosome segregation protein